MKPPHGDRNGGSNRFPPGRSPPGRPPAGRFSQGQPPSGQPPSGQPPSGNPRHGRPANSGAPSGHDPKPASEAPPNRLSLQSGQPDPRPARPPFQQRPEGNQKRPEGKRFDQRPPQGDGGQRAADTPKGTVWLYGFHAVAAALANPRRRLRRLLLTAEAETALIAIAPPPWPLAHERADRARIDQLLGRDIAHQGVALLADPLAQPSLAEVLERNGPIVVLDQVNDPRNVGAILRTAAAFGASAVIAQDRNAPEETGSLAKAASGMMETMPLLRAVNIARTLIALKAANVWCVGLDAGGEPLSGGFYSGRRVALVLGAEGDGLRRLTRETCDAIAGLSIKGAVESLNVSAAAAVALYELTRNA